MDGFVTYFWGNDPARIKLCQEFCDRYPQVHLLQNGYEIESQNTTHFMYENVGFIDYKMINSFIMSNDLRTLTMIDSDLVLGLDFFEKITNKHRKIESEGPAFITIRNSFHSSSTRFEPSMAFNAYKNTILGHTGYVHSFNKAFLNAYKFNDKFVYGGYDYIIQVAIVSNPKSNIPFIQSEYDRLLALDVAFDYIDCDVIHHDIHKFIPTNWDLYL